MAAAVVAGVHPSIPEAQEAMGGGFEKEYHPDPAMVRIYDSLYDRYKRFGTFIEGET
jgi:L-ribulokinase